MSAVVLRPDFARGVSVIEEPAGEPAGAQALMAFARGGVVELPIQPSAAADVMRLCQMAELPFDRMASTIVQEPSLAARVLQMANSAFYGTTKPVANIAHALMRVGERGLRSVLLGAASGRVLFVRGHPELTRRLQVRSVAVAVATESVLRRVGNTRDDAFAAGLLHDIGWSAGVGLAARYRAQLPAEWAADPTALLAAVDHVHAELGAVVTELWRFPPTISAAIRWHHQPELASVGSPLAYAVSAAIRLTDRLAISPEAPAVPDSHPVYIRLRLDPDQQLEVRREVWVELERLGLVRDRRRSPQPVRVDRRKK